MTKQREVIPVEEVGALRTRTVALAAEHARLYAEMERLGKLSDRLLAENRAMKAGGLTLGEAITDDVGDPELVPTPAQWIARWNQLDHEGRLDWAARILASGETAFRCFAMDHEGQIEMLRERLEAK